MNPLCVIKLGGAAITSAEGPTYLDSAVATSLAAELAAIPARLVLVHGTGAVGKPPAVEFGYVHDGTLPAARAHLACEIHRRLRDLNQAMVTILLEAGIPALGVDPGLLFNDQFDGWRDPAAATFLLELLSQGIVPVLYGDMVPRPAGGFRVLSSDVIACLLAVGLTTDHLIFLSDVPGVLVAGSAGPDGKILDEISLRNLDQPGLFSATDAGDVSGGMGAKLRMAISASKHCRSCWIGSGRTPGILTEFFASGVITGTWIRPLP